MDLKSFNFKVKRNLEDGLSLLTKEYPTQVSDGKKSVIVGIDGGSTSTRVLILDSEDNYRPESVEEIWEIPSTHAELQTSEIIRKQSNELYEQLDSWITCAIPSDKSIFDKCRVLRGTKFIDSGVGATRINSSDQKVDSPAFYINLIDGIGYGLVMKYGKDLVSEYDVYAGVSLRPDDINSTKNRDKFLNRIIGQFLWENKDLGVKITINVKGVVLQTEPEASVKGYYTKSGEVIPDLVFLLEGGGSSFGVEVLRRGKTVHGAAKTLPYGGNKLMSKVESIYLNGEGGKYLTDDQLKGMLTEGYLKKGRSEIDAVPYVVRAKDEFARDVYSDIKKRVFDLEGSIDITEIETFLFSGRIFRKGEFKPSDEDSLTGYSLAQPLIEMLKKENESAEYAVIPTNLIPFGNAILSLSSYGGYLEEDDEEEEEEIAEDTVESEDFSDYGSEDVEEEIEE